MTRRGAILTIAALLLSTRMGRAQVNLNAEDDLETLRQTLEAGVTGTAQADLETTLEGLGARGVARLDLSPETYPEGTELGPGAVIGPDPVVSAIFGLRRGFLRNDRRVQVYFARRDGRLADLLWIDTFAK